MAKALLNLNRILKKWNLNPDKWRYPCGIHFIQQLAISTPNICDAITFARIQSFKANHHSGFKNG